jgi:hypothetical protein
VQNHSSIEILRLLHDFDKDALQAWAYEWFGITKKAWVKRSRDQGLQRRGWEVVSSLGARVKRLGAREATG